MTRKIVLTDEQIEARLEKKRQYQREWSKANHERRYARLKERMAADPEFEAKVKSRWEANRKKRRASGADKYESPESKEKRLNRERKYREKKKQERKLANPAQPRSKVEQKVKKCVTKTEAKKKPGRLLALMGWAGY